MGCGRKGFTEEIGCRFMNADLSNYEYCEDGTGRFKKCYRKTKSSKVTPPKKPDPKKPDPKKPDPKNVCKDKYGNEISSSKFEPEFFEVEGLKQFKKFLIKYYPNFVNEEGGVEKLNSATVKDCMLMRLFYTGDPDKSYYAIGDLIYPDWKTYVGGYMNSDSKSKEDFDAWKKGGETSDEEENTNFSDADWQTLIDNGQVSKKGVIKKIKDIYVLILKYDSNGNRVVFDDLKTDNTLDFTKMKKNINDGTYTYAYLKPPVKNDDSYSEYPSSEYPLQSKKYKFIIKYDANKEAYLSWDSKPSVVFFEPPKVKIDESNFKKFLLEKIREKKEYKTIFVEDITTPSPTGGTDEDDRDIEATSTPKPKPNTTSGSQKPADDIFGLNSIENVNARKLKYEELTPILQSQLSGGSRSDYFAEWNKVGAELGSKLKLIIPEIQGINLQYYGKEIKDDNEILVGEPAEQNKYTRRYFYELLDIKGNSSVNTATIYQPLRSTTQQKIVVGKCDIQQCRKDLIYYLKLGLSNSYVPANEQELFDIKRNLCNCNASGCFEAFKSRGKLAGKGFEEKGYSRDKLNIDRSSEKNVFIDDESGLNIVTKDVLPRYNKTFNRNLSWKEMVNLLSGGWYLTPGGQKAQIDADLRIANFGKSLGWCDENLNLSSVPTTQKESFDKRIDNKLLESIKNKNKKESIIENVLRNLLKDK